MGRGQTCPMTWRTGDRSPKTFDRSGNRSASWCTRIWLSDRLVFVRSRGWHNVGRLWHSRFAGVRSIGRSAATGRNLWLSDGWSRLRIGRLIQISRDRPDLGDLANDCKHGRRHGRRRWARYVGIATAAAIGVSLCCLIAWAFRLSVLVKLISDSVLTGFKAGAGLTIAITQLPALLGVAGGGHNVPDRLYILAAQLGATNLTTLAIGLAALALLWGIGGCRVVRLHSAWSRFRSSS